MEIVAEGVEERARRRSLRALGCEYLQGFLLGRPMRPDAAARAITPRAAA